MCSCIPHPTPTLPTPDMICLSSPLSFISLPALSCRLGLFIIVFGQQHRDTYDNHCLVCFTKAPYWSAVISGLLRYRPSHLFSMFWNNSSSSALSKPPSNKTELCWDGLFHFFYLCSLGAKKNFNHPQIKLKEKTVGDSAWQEQGAFHYDQIDVEWLSG